MIKPSDLKVKEAVETVFTTTVGSDVDATLKSRNLLHHWSLSRVERLSFRSPLLPDLIFKSTLPPLQRELDIYEGLLKDSPTWAANFYGYVWNGDELWMFLEDVGSVTLQNQPAEENLWKVTNLLAGLQVAFQREVSSWELQSRIRLKVMDYHTYVEEARQAFSFTKTLVDEGKFKKIDARGLQKLETVVNMYEKVALALVGAPQTLVHGDFNPSNIAFAGDRIVLLDWATAYIGTGLIDLVDLANFAISNFGAEIMPKLLQNYRRAYRQASGEQLDREPLEELLVCSQIEKKLSQIRWFDQCALIFIPTGAQAYDYSVANLIDDVYELATILV
jgi:thiamine kinase-like enzyme